LWNAGKQEKAGPPHSALEGRANRPLPQPAATGAPSMKILETKRLHLREFAVGDAPFILELVNDASWRRYIGDRGIRTLEQAQTYILQGPVASYAQHGFGLYLVGRKSDGAAIGMCGLLKRAALDDVDLGFAFLPAYCGHGYALESATGTLAHARAQLGLSRIVAVTNPDNTRSILLLDKLGFRFERLVQLAPADAKLKLYASQP
jgi:RimJ/RimL family protein N-acetyltransferase